MGDLKLPTPDEIASRRFEEQVYEAVLREIEAGSKRPGLWAKALSQAGGDEAKAKALYLRFRAQSLLDEAWVAADEQEKRPGRESALLDAAMYGRTPEVAELLQHELNINVTNSNGATALYLAALNGHVEIVRMLLARGADPSIRNDAGRSPRQAAESALHHEIASLLAAA
jgi:hypothetical protein